MQTTAQAVEVGGPSTVYDHLVTAAYLALGLDDPPITMAAWMIACEAAWIDAACTGQRDGAGFQHDGDTCPVHEATA